MSAMEQFTEAFCEKAISVFIILVPEINNVEREAPWLAEAYIAAGILDVAEAGKKAFADYRKTHTT